MSIELAVFVLGVGLLALVVVLARLGSLRSEIRDLQASERRNGELIQNLTKRVYTLEQGDTAREARADEPRTVPAILPTEPPVPSEPAPAVPVSSAPVPLFPPQPEPVVKSARTRE